MRAIPISKDGRLWLEPLDVYLHNPRGDEMRRWPARNAANGPIELEYPLGDPTIIGTWVVAASVRNSASPDKRFRKTFHVMNHSPTGFEIQVSLNSWFVVPSDEEVSGFIKAFTTIGGQIPVHGLLSIEAILTSESEDIKCKSNLYFKANNQVKIFPFNLAYYKPNFKSFKHII